MWLSVLLEVKALSVTDPDGSKSEITIDHSNAHSTGK